jgi:hypothetical protein
MSQRQLNHLTNSRHLLPATANVVITNIVQLLLIFTTNRLTFGIEHSIGSNNTKLFRLSGHNFEFHWLEITSHHKQVTLLYGPVGILEIGYQIRFG